MQIYRKSFVALSNAGHNIMQVCVTFPRDAVEEVRIDCPLLQICLGEATF